MKKFIVRLANDTIGEVTTSREEKDLIGQTENIILRDENGNRIERTGMIIEVLEEV